MNESIHNELTSERIEASIEYMEEMYRCCDTQTGNVPKAYATALAALRAEQERLNPKPLTLEELRGMDGEPVWCVDCFGNQCWAIVNVQDDDCIDKETGAWNMGLYGVTDKPIDLTGWLAYRAKPEWSAE
jgi:hypothetical protein